MIMKKFVFIIAVMGIVVLAAINVVLNSNAPIASNLTLQNLEAYTGDESGGESSGNVICHTSRVCKRTVYENGEWIEKENGIVGSAEKSTTN
jgi:hypothetical protein